MKPFNLGLAKAGHPVVCRNGQKARIICFDVKEGGISFRGAGRGQLRRYDLGRLLSLQRRW